MEGTFTAAVGAGFTLASGVAFYLASPHRKVWVGRKTRTPAIIAGALLSLLGLILLAQGLAPLAAGFTWATLLMLALTLAPFLPLLRGSRA